MEINQEKREEIIKLHKEGVKEMEDDIKILEKKLGANHSVVDKLKQINNVMTSMTDDEVITLTLEMDQIIKDEDED